MNYKNIIRASLPFILLVNSCSKDLGNYDLKAINEVSILEVAEEYALMRTIDTLHIDPQVTHTLSDGSEDRFDYYWILRVKGERTPDTIANSRKLNFPVDLPPEVHDLQFRVVDKETDVAWWVDTKLDVGTPFSRGILLIGENEQGVAEAEMLSMLNDTLILRDILEQSGLPSLENPRALFHTGGSNIYKKLWVLTQSGSYYLDPLTMQGDAANNFGSLVYTTDPIDRGNLHPVVIAPQIRTADGSISSTSVRATITQNGYLFGAYLLLNGGDFYTNPLNRTEADYNTLLKAAPYLLYSIGNMNAVTWYDTDNNRFLHYSGFGLSTASVIPEDQPGDPFPWDQVASGRSLVYAENTRNSDGGSAHGNSFAIMKNAENQYFIYKFYAFGSKPVKRAAYTVSAIATGFDQADFYAFSSNRSVVFYSVDNRLYAYDYNPGKERLYTFPQIGSDEITMLKFDTQIDHLSNSLYIATYNTTTKGTLRRYIVGNNPNVLQLTLAENSTWDQLIKIKDFNWRAVN